MSCKLHFVFSACAWSRHKEL